ncbi:Kunitz/Bovine pancreatic trypsin inhibitor domain protein [Ditylenchus destructor]|nr:Kunitz/Bovine pancreatic trypsin inhibitor domain protein [Ditylenchus destructor]
MTKVQPSSHGSSSSGHEKPHTSFSKVPKVVPKCKDGSLPWAVGCHNSALRIEKMSVLRTTNKSQLCDPVMDSCPSGYSGALWLMLTCVALINWTVDMTCQQRTNGTLCYKNYCACQEGRLIHESKCVLQCPEGFLNIAGRCHDLTTIVFMDSVEERKNGTLGGYCKATVVREEQCEVESGYCNERSITCQCKPRFELHIGDVGDKEDKGSCKRVEDSKFPHDSSKDAEKRLLDEVMDEGDPENDSMNNPAQSPMTFYIIEANDAPTTNSTVKGSSSTKIDSAKPEQETKKGNGVDKPLKDAKGIDSIFLQQMMINDR